MNDRRRSSSLATLLVAAGMWLLLPRVRPRRPGGRRGAGRWSAWGMLASQVPGLGGWIDGGVFYVLAGVTVVAAAGHGHPPQPALLGHLVRHDRCWARPGCSCSRGPSSWPWPPSWSTPGRSWSPSCSCSCWPSPEGRAAYDRVSWEALVSAATGAVIVGILSMTVTGVLTGPNVRCRRLPRRPAARRRACWPGSTSPHLGGELFGRHLIAVEVAGTLLLAALVGRGGDRGPRPGAVGGGCGGRSGQERAE